MRSPKPKYFSARPVNSPDSPPDKLRSAGSRRSNYKPRNKPHPLLMGPSSHRNYTAKYLAQQRQMEANDTIQRVAAAHVLKIKQLQNQLGEAELKIDELIRENRILKTLQGRQEGALKRFEYSKSELPYIIRSHKEEMRVLTTSLKSSKVMLKEFESKIKDKESEVEILRKSNEKLNRIVSENQLIEIQDVQKQLLETDAAWKKAEKNLLILSKKRNLELKNMRHQLNTEILKHKDTEKELQRALQIIVAVEKKYGIKGKMLLESELRQQNLIKVKPINEESILEGVQIIKNDKGSRKNSLGIIDLENNVKEIFKQEETTNLDSESLINTNLLDTKERKDVKNNTKTDEKKATRIDRRVQFDEKNENTLADKTKSLKDQPKIITNELFQYEDEPLNYRAKVRLGFDIKVKKQDAEMINLAKDMSKLRAKLKGDRPTSKTDIKLMNTKYQSKEYRPRTRTSEDKKSDDELKFLKEAPKSKLFEGKSSDEELPNPKFSMRNRPKSKSKLIAPEEKSENESINGSPPLRSTSKLRIGEKFKHKPEPRRIEKIVEMDEESLPEDNLPTKSSKGDVEINNEKTIIKSGSDEEVGLTGDLKTTINTLPADRNPRVDNGLGDFKSYEQKQNLLRALRQTTMSSDSESEEETVHTIYSSKMPYHEIQAIPVSGRKSSSRERMLMEQLFGKK